MVESWCALRAGDRATGAGAWSSGSRRSRWAGSRRGSVAHRALLRAMLADDPAAAGAVRRRAIPLARVRRHRRGGWLIALAEQAKAGIEGDAALAEVRAILERLGATAALDRIAPPASQARTAVAK